MKKTFNQWNKGELQREFDLQPIEECEALDAWLAMPNEVPIVLDDFEQSLLERVRSQAKTFIEEWNEWELREQFIGIVVNLASFNDAKRLVSTFSERTIEAKVKGVRNHEDIELSGKVDWMVASGMGTPEKPFFFIHEYKQEGGSSRNNSGQLLATMLAAQELNDDRKPIYGAYVVGRMWFLVVLQGRTYCMTDAYVSTKEHELQEILRLLKAQKLMINERV
ncbi:MAG: hypothetical protein AAF639_00395 [Chloroflexota bacterium]